MLSLFPVACCGDVAAASRFYCDLLGLTPSFESDWYVQLQHPDDASVQLAFVQRDHETVPEGYRHAPAGVLVTMERDDVDDVHERAVAMGLPIELPLRDEAFGQRHFMTRDPMGLLVDVVKIIPPSKEFAAGYVAP